MCCVDTNSETKLGEFPLDRAHYAKALDRAAEFKAKAVVFKFFFDQPRNAASDAAQNGTEFVLTVDSSRVVLR